MLSGLSRSVTLALHFCSTPALPVVGGAIVTAGFVGVNSPRPLGEPTPDDPSKPVTALHCGLNGSPTSALPSYGKLQSLSPPGCPFGSFSPFGLPSPGLPSGFCDSADSTLAQFCESSPAHHPLPPTVMSYDQPRLFPSLTSSAKYRELDGWVACFAPPFSAHIAATSGEASEVPPIVIQPLAW